MRVLKTCKWYQTVRLVKMRRLVPSVTFLGQTLKLSYLDQYVSTMLFVMTSGDLNIDLNQIFFFTKVVGLSTNYQTPVRRGDRKAPPPADSEPFRARPE